MLTYLFYNYFLGITAEMCVYWLTILEQNHLRLNVDKTSGDRLQEEEDAFTATMDRGEVVEEVKDYKW